MNVTCVYVALPGTMIWMASGSHQWSVSTLLVHSQVLWVCVTQRVCLRCVRVYLGLN